MNEFKYIFTWLLILVGLGIGLYMCFARSKDLIDQRLELEAKFAKYIGYSYISASILAIIVYKV